jgi:hypothetical protein
MMLRLLKSSEPKLQRFFQPTLAMLSEPCLYSCRCITTHILDYVITVIILGEESRKKDYPETLRGPKERTTE